jgi:alkylated DNA repair dioxygenase AlkB
MVGLAATRACRTAERVQAWSLSQLRLLPFMPTVPAVPGLVYVEEYLSREEELELLSAVDGEPWLLDWQRRRQVYGVAYSGPQAGAPLRPLPEWLSGLVQRVRAEGYLEAEVVNAVINEYLPGQGIGAHRDHPAFGPTVVAVSLGGATTLELAKPDAPARSSLPLDVQPRSLWALSGEARAHWTHRIAARHNDVVGGSKRPRERRVSITLRTLAAPQR